jgi:hypothetical protein
MVNQGTILADLATALTIDPNALGFTNSGSVQATGSGGLVIGDGPFVTSGSVAIGSGSSVTRYGDFTQTAAGVVEVSLGSAPGQIHVTGTASLAGTMRVKVPAGFAPTLGSTCEILTFASRSGDFAAYDGLTQPSGLQFEPSFTDTSLHLRVVREAFTPTPTATLTPTPALPVTVTPPATRTATPLPTATAASSATATPTGSPTATGLPTTTGTASPTRAPSATVTPTLPPSPTSTPPPDATVTPTATRTPIGCVGDCGNDGVVTVAELIRAVNIALETLPLDVCTAIDRDGNGRATIDELLQAVNNGLGECTRPA